MDIIGEKDIDFINEKKRVLGELLRNGQIEIGQLMDHEQFSNLHALYKYSMNEKEFCEMLEINTGGHYRMEHGEKAGILKGIQNELVRIKKIQKTDLGKACIEMLNKYNELGLTREQAIERTRQMLGISPEEMLKIMQDYQAKQKKREAVQNEGVAL